ncbi:MAG TPA: hypothetical protein VLM40_16975, partial [Gemmata sp.]|nr:hypothetical protein [Gemmata sp.]
MTHDPHDVVRVFSGTLIEVESYQQALTAAGIESRIVGTELTAGLGTAIPGSIELWVHRSDFDKSVAAIKLDDEERGRQHEPEKFPRPTD